MTNQIPTLAQLHSLVAQQQPQYDDANELDSVLAELRTRPPLVFAGECDELRRKIADVAAGRSFLLQGGDCAENFDSVTAQDIRGKLRVLLSMAVVLTYAAQMPVVKVGRIAGQYAKPRSKDYETRNGVSLPSYRGDGVNSLEFTPAARRHDPTRLIEVYNRSSATLNLLRAFVKGGFADLRTVHTWNSDFVHSSNVEERYETMAAEIERAMAFMVACGVDDASIRTVDLYSSHEALLLEYEHALTRIDSRTLTPYDTSAHMVWVGERTRRIDGAHVEFVRHLRNPIGFKFGPTIRPDEAVELLNRVDPDHEPGRITIITRMGANLVGKVLPELVGAVTSTGREVAWVCDPMHGNTFTSENGYKTRAFADVVAEVNGFFDVHNEMGTWPGGVHIELTGDDVTECVGGVDELDETDLISRYETACDPRLNRNQSLELAFTIAERLSKGIPGRSNAVQAYRLEDF
ncbi:MAG: 3-deoxy-7-phosphoheptulonate synthase class II [Propionibacteriaceae bacterium]|nr:3-deoxy-7-phosphoheptulonate synthase class II [Propionibacteriaceae bacterium]